MAGIGLNFHVEGKSMDGVSSRIEERGFEASQSILMQCGRRLQHPQSIQKETKEEEKNGRNWIEFSCRINRLKPESGKCIVRDGRILADALRIFCGLKIHRIPPPLPPSISENTSGNIHFNDSFPPELNWKANDKNMKLIFLLFRSIFEPEIGTLLFSSNDI